jgi:hypothetical protein
VTPVGREDQWKRLWGKTRVLDDVATEAAFEEFQEQFVPSHMRKLFLRFFGVRRAHFGNRFFREEAAYHRWETKLSALIEAEGENIEVILIYALDDRLEAHVLKGQRRRSLRDIVVDDKQAACGIVRAGAITLYLFIEPKMRGCIVRSVQKSLTPEEKPEI